MLNAIMVTLVRVFITKKNLLEWVTSEAVEKSQENSLKSYLKKMVVTIIAAPIPLVLAIAFKKEAIIISLFFFALWISSPFIAYLVSKDQKESVPKASEEELNELRRIARKTWRYFEEFSNIDNNYLAPDNYQPDSPKGVANRTSPTNIGFGLLAVLTARDFGYIGTYEMMELVDKAVSTIEGLKKWNGHLYNWYDTRTLNPLEPGYISTVDSGNLAGYLITLVQGLKEYFCSPLIDYEFINGIRDTLYCGEKEGILAYDTIISNHEFQDKEETDLIIWNQLLNELMMGNIFDNMEESVWKVKIVHMIQMFKIEITELLPVIDLLEKIPQELVSKNSNEEIVAKADEIIIMLRKNTDLQDLPHVYDTASNKADELIEIVQKTGTENYEDGLIWLYEFKKTLKKSAETVKQFIGRYNILIERINMLLDAMKFLPLFDKKKQLFSIGYDIEENKLNNSFYDLLASEARQTSYICIARGEISSTHWFKMSRVLTVVDRFKGLVSWTGTMFEYLMPLLIMRSYKNTLLDETYSFVVKSQEKYGRQRDMPWGSSESGYNSVDKNLEYQYKAIGVPWLGLKRGLIEDAVVAPYATFLALLVDPEGAMENIELLKAEGLEGPYGFYEAVDYTPERLLFEAKRSIVKSFMAHHQGMSLLALNNYINKNIMQRRFFADPEMNAARLLLQEKVPTNLVITKENKEKVVRFKGIVFNTKNPLRRFSEPDPILPKVHILSNGNYSVMITDKGTGYSKNKTIAVTRWREDSTLNPYGMFFYLRNVDTNYIWSATYAPMNIMPDKYEVIFTGGKATFIRFDGQIETKTEVVVASGNNVEIRRLTLKNFGDKPCVIEVTSYFEVVLAVQAADVAHPAFGNLFVETQFLPEKKCIIANRRPRSETDKSIWIGNTAVIEGEELENSEYETDRMQFVGRDHNVKAPVAIANGKPLSNTAGSVLDPAMSIRVKVKIEPGKTEIVSFVTVVSESNELLLSLIDNYANPDSVEGAFQ
ncbi:MAG: glucoamylase family protein, partial [Sedimentibacter sp.]